MKLHKPIVIRDTETLNRIYEYVREDCHGYVDFREEIERIRNIANGADYHGILWDWMQAVGVIVCSEGEKRILSEAGKVNSWKEYFRKHWKDPEARNWLLSVSECLCDRSFLVMMKGVSFEQFLKHNPRIRWAKWPFPKKSNRRR